MDEIEQHLKRLDECNQENMRYNSGRQGRSNNDNGRNNRQSGTWRNNEGRSNQNRWQNTRNGNVAGNSGQTEKENQVGTIFARDPDWLIEEDEIEGGGVK